MANTLAAPAHVDAYSHAGIDPILAQTTAREITRFTWIIKEIVELSADGLVDEFAIINQDQTENHKHTKTGNEELINRLIDEHWLARLGSGEEQIGLG